MANEAGAATEAARPAREALIADYVAAEDALRAFTDRNFGRMCAACARWTLYAAQVNAQADTDPTLRPSTLEARGQRPEDPTPWPPSLQGKGNDGQPEAARRGTELTWRLSSWVTNCCNANHALESMSDEALAGIVASREAGREWWQKVKRAAAAPCRALTDQGCYLARGRPELCNRYFCEAVRDYLWLIGGERAGARLAERLDDLQRRWATLYAVYQRAIVALPGAEPAGGATPPARAATREAAGWGAFFAALADFDREIARCVRPITAAEMADRLFKVAGPRAAYEPFWQREMAAIEGQIRRPETAPVAAP